MGEEDSTKMSSTQTLSYPTPIEYSKFEMGDQKNTQAILDIWKDFDSNTLANSSDKFADSVTVLFSGMESTTSRDSTLASISQYRGMFNQVNSRIDAIMPIKSTDHNQDMVLVWGTEVHTDKNNKTDSVHLHETWMLDKDGKVNVIMQYQRMAPVKS